MQKRIDMNLIRLVSIVCVLFLFQCRSENKRSIDENKDSIFNKDDITSVDSSYLYDRSIVGKISTGKNDWYIVSARTCKNCDENIALYLISKNKLIGYDSLKLQSYSYPGRLYSFDDHLIFESRVFYGNCYKDSTKVIVWIQSEKLKDNSWNKETYILQLTDSAIVKIGFSNYSLKDIEVLINKGLCFELIGRDMTEEP